MHPKVWKLLMNNPRELKRENAAPWLLPKPEDLPRWIPKEIREDKDWIGNFYEVPELLKKQYWTYDKDKAKIAKRVKDFYEIDNLKPLTEDEALLIWKGHLAPQRVANRINYHDVLLELGGIRRRIPKIASVEWVIPAMNGALIEWVNYFDQRATPGTYLNELDQSDFNILTEQLVWVEGEKHFQCDANDPRRLEDDERVTEDYLVKMYKLRKKMPDTLPGMYEKFYKNPPPTVKKTQYSMYFPRDAEELYRNILKWVNDFLRKKR